MVDDVQVLLRAILSVCARQAFPPESLAKIVSPTGAAQQIKAFNLCDGSRTQREVAQAAKLDPGNFSRTVTRWIEQGVMVRLGESKEAKLLHVYPVSADAVVKAPAARNAK